MEIVLAETILVLLIFTLKPRVNDSTILLFQNSRRCGILMYYSEEDSDSLVEGFDPVGGIWVTSNRTKNLKRNDDIIQHSSSATNGNRGLSQDTVKSLERPLCPSCGKTGIRKRYMQCAVCSRHWHMSCVHLSRGQADALSRWWCPDCVKSSSQPFRGAEPEVGQNVIPGDHQTTTSGQKSAPPAPQQQEPEAPGMDEDLGRILAGLRRSRPVVRRIPKGARIVAADALANLLEKAVASSEHGPWSKLMRFPYEALSVKEELNNSSLTKKIKQQITTYADTSCALSSQKDSTKSTYRAVANDRKKKMSGDKLKRGVELKLSDGDVKGAIRLLSSSDTVAGDTLQTIDALREKHPPAPDDACLPPVPDESTQPLLASCADVEAAVKSFSSGSSAGLDGLRPSHLKDLIGLTCGEAGRRLTTALTSLVNLALRGEIPRTARESFFTASLLALEKSCGGVRPIAIGSTYRRLATKVALRPLSSEIGNKLRPTQLGFGTTGGCEAAAHATRHFVNRLSGEEVVVKIDMRNAFNSVRRDHILGTLYGIVRPRCIHFCGRATVNLLHFITALPR